MEDNTCLQNLMCENQEIAGGAESSAGHRRHAEHAQLLAPQSHVQLFREATQLVQSLLSRASKAGLPPP